MCLTMERPWSPWSPAFEEVFVLHILKICVRANKIDTWGEVVSLGFAFKCLCELVYVSIFICAKLLMWPVFQWHLVIANVWG